MKFSDYLKSRAEKLSKYSFHHKKRVEDMMDSIVVNNLSSSTIKDSIAYVTRKGDSSIYEKFVSDRVPECYDAFNIHECGHLLLQHIRFGFEKEFERVSIAIKAHWSGLKKYIDWEMDRQPTFQEIQETQKNLISMIANIAQDFEVNTTFFDEDEKDMLNYALETHVLATMSDNPANKKALQDYAKTKKPVARGMFPDDYKFPRKLNWIAYLDLILANPEKFMQELAKNYSNHLSQGSPDNSGSPSKGPSSGGKIPKSAIDKGDIDGSSIRDTFSDDQPVAQSIDESEKNEEQTFERHGFSYLNGGDNGSQMHKLSKAFKESLKSIESFIMDAAVKQSKVTQKHDQLFNYNRGKTKQVLVPRTRENTLRKLENVYILVDCSSSVPTDAVERIVNVCKNVAPRVGRNSRVVYWDTQLLCAKRLHESLDYVPQGDCTYLARGIQYIADNYLVHDKDGIFIVISDFQDSLNAWKEPLKKFSYQYGLQWSYEKGVEPMDVSGYFPKMKIQQFLI